MNKVKVDQIDGWAGSTRLSNRPPDLQFQLQFLQSITVHLRSSKGDPSDHQLKIRVTVNATHHLVFEED